jgi:type III restriction enzyme
MVWPVQIFEQGKFPDVSQIDVSTLPRYSTLLDFEQLRKELGKMLISERHVETGKKTGTWKLESKYFNYEYFLQRATRAVAEEGKTTILSGHLSEVAEVIDRYVSDYLFEHHVDFSDSENYHVLNYSLIFDHVVSAIRTRLLKLMGDIQYETTGAWNRLSNVNRLMIRENYSVETHKCIYPKQAFSSVGGGFEKKFIEEVLEPSVSVTAHSKLDRKHGLIIPYRDEFGILREYWVDFLIKARDKMYLVETKSDRDINTPNVAIKAKAAKRWSETASTVIPTAGVNQPQTFEYLIMSEKLFEADVGFSFEGFVALCRALRDRIISNYNATHNR